MKIKRNNIIFLIVIAILLIPKTRKPIQVFIQKGLALISPSVISENKQSSINDYYWKLKDEKGAIFNFKEAKGKVVLINFWATWCPPCIAEMPSLQKLYTDYHDKIEFVFISNESFKTINSFLEKNSYTFKIYNEVSKSKFFNIRGIPRTFLIDKQGKVLIDKTGAANWNSESVRQTIDDLLK
ncbi:TlpA family protein disulfide reductase [Sabulilitoribacter arenilitoris]|uniref:TlpA family protein disulfide reductase n=1 Tax=Wocania arenilitoris TaxID=2044858 RepID=A0AAE3ENV0_9FLAO|nr:TlpA disulfide reductase family protein [Wocania arenilitoris]MCF7568242.1 TlpA family protein disulfide reductase [Wocania arenilitoris]